MDHALSLFERVQLHFGHVRRNCFMLYLSNTTIKVHYIHSPILIKTELPKLLLVVLVDPRNAPFFSLGAEWYVAIEMTDGNVECSYSC